MKQENCKPSIEKITKVEYKRKIRKQKKKELREISVKAPIKAEAWL